jgi:hypothetical protein
LGVNVLGIEEKLNKPSISVAAQRRDAKAVPTQIDARM